MADLLDWVPADLSFDLFGEGLDPGQFALDLPLDTPIVPLTLTGEGLPTDQFYDLPAELFDLGPTDLFFPEASGLIQTPPGSGITLNDVLRAASLGLGLGAAGLGIGGALASGLGGSSKSERTTTATSTSTRAPMSPEQQALLGAIPGAAGGGLLGLSGQALGALTGPFGLPALQADLLLGLPGMVPQLNPLLQQALQTQALGMSMGLLPGLDPGITGRLDTIYAAREQDINRFLDRALQGVLERSRQQGFHGGTEVLREGTPAALLAPALAEATRQFGTLAGQRAAQEIELAQTLPLLASQLAFRDIQAQAIPFQAALGATSAFNAPTVLQAELPFRLFDILERGRTTTTTQTQVGPQPSLLQSLAQAAPFLSAAGNIFTGLSMTQPGGFWGLNG